MLLDAWLQMKVMPFPLPADVVYGDISELLIHGGLALLVVVDVKCGHGMLVGDVDFDLSSSFGG